MTRRIEENGEEKHKKQPNGSESRASLEQDQCRNFRNQGLGWQMKGDQRLFTSFNVTFCVLSMERSTGDVEMRSIRLSARVTYITNQLQQVPALRRRDGLSWKGGLHGSTLVKAGRWWRARYSLNLNSTV